MKKKVFSYVFWAAVAAVLVWLCLRKIDWSAFRTALEQCRWSFVLLSMFLGALSIFIRALRWRMLLKPLDPAVSIITCFNAYNIGMVVNLAVPRAGELARMGYVVRHSTQGADGKRLAGADKVIGTILTERVWDVFFIALITTVTVFASWDDFGTFVAGILGGSTNIAWLLGGLAAVAALAVWLLWRLRNRGGVWGRIWGFVAGIGRGIGSFRQMEKGWLFLLYTLIIWTLYWLMSASILWALPHLEERTLLDALFLSLVGTISTIIPVPGGFGVYHGMVSGTMQALWKLPLETSMVYAVLNHESQVITHAILGLGSYLHESFFRRSR